MEIKRINDYFEIAQNADTITKFHALTRKLAFHREEFTRRDALDLLYIIDNEQENLLKMAEAFRNSGENIQTIPTGNWDSLRFLVTGLLAQMD
jgi:hypothetical protein